MSIKADYSLDSDVPVDDDLAQASDIALHDPHTLSPMTLYASVLTQLTS